MPPSIATLPILVRSARTVIVYKSTMRSGLPDFAAHLGFFAKSTRLPQIEVLPVTRCTVRHMLPVLILLDILKPR